MKYQGIIKSAVVDPKDYEKTAITVEIPGGEDCNNITLMLYNNFLQVPNSSLQGKKVSILYDKNTDTIKKILGDISESQRGSIYAPDIDAIRLYETMNVNDLFPPLSMQQQYNRLEILLQDPLVRDSIEKRYDILPPYIKQYFYLEPINIYKDITPLDYQKIVFLEQVNIALIFFENHSNKDIAKEGAKQAYDKYLNEIVDQSCIHTKEDFFSCIDALAGEYTLFHQGQESKHLSCIKEMHHSIHPEIIAAFMLPMEFLSFYSRSEANKILCLHHIQHLWKDYAHKPQYYPRVNAIYAILQKDLQPDYHKSISVDDYADMLTLDSSVDFDKDTGVQKILEYYIEMSPKDFESLCAKDTYGYDFIVNICDALDIQDTKDSTKISCLFLCVQMLKHMYEKRGYCYESTKK